MSKPNWNNAPEWAQWVAQDADGQWTWYDRKPMQFNTHIWYNDSQYFVAYNDEANNNWQKTLEERPVSVNSIDEKEAVNHPAHYNQIAGIECIDVARHFSFNQGNVIKYIWRAYHKGATIEDLEKAVWYLQDEIKMLREKH